MKKLLHKLFGGLGSISARRGANDPKRYKIRELIGQGTFGSVYEAKDRVTDEIVAIKKIEMGDDSNAENELEISEEVDHPNAISLRGHFRESRKIEGTAVDYMCLVLEYSKTSLKDLLDHRKTQGRMSPQMVRLLAFQIFRVLHYMHSKSIMHRDIKPSNFLVDRSTYVLKISDFGSAKRLVVGESRSAKVCSAPYRAPELELGNEDYDAKIDIWAAGCVVAECATGEVLFRQVRNVKHYDLIRALLGDPTADDVAELQPLLKYQPMGHRCAPTIDERFGQLQPPLPPSTIAFVKKTLQYRPSKRPSAIALLAEEFFSPLRRLPEHQKVLYHKVLYEFSEDELEDVSPELLERIVPPEFRNEAVMQRLSQGSTKTAQPLKEPSQLKSQPTPQP